MDLTGLSESNSFSDFTAKSSNPPAPAPSPPPIPSRTSQVATSYAPQQYPTSNLFNAYSNYSNLNSSSFYNGGMYTSPFGSSATGAYAMNGSNNQSNSFLRSAEESTRGAFQSIESVVQAFSAVSAMFESTYYAVYNSFRAVVGVADQFYRLKTHLSGIVSAVALLKVLKYIYRKCLRILKLTASIVTDSPSPINSMDDEAAWSTANSIKDSESFVKNTRKHHTNWPLIMFLAVVLGGPWLIWKILSSINSKDDSLWMSGKVDHFIAAAEFDFDSVNVDELSFRRGQRIIIAPKEFQPKLRGWLLGTVDGKTQGIMPANYLKILGKKPGSGAEAK